MTTLRVVDTYLPCPVCDTLFQTEDIAHQHEQLTRCGREASCELVEVVPADDYDTAVAYFEAQVKRAEYAEKMADRHYDELRRIAGREDA